MLSRPSCTSIRVSSALSNFPSHQKLDCTGKAFWLASLMGVMASLMAFAPATLSMVVATHGTPLAWEESLASAIVEERSADRKTGTESADERTAERRGFEE